MRPTLTAVSFPTLRRAAEFERDAEAKRRDEQLLKDRRAILACRVLGISPDVVFKPVSITSKAASDADVVVL